MHVLCRSGVIDLLLWYTCLMKQIISTRTYRAMYRLLDRVSPISGDCGRLCGSICCTIGNTPEIPNYSDNILLQHIEDVNQQTPYKMLNTVSTDPSDSNEDVLPDGDEEQVLGIYLYPGEESLFLGQSDSLKCAEDGTTYYCAANGTPLYEFETEDALDYEYPDSWAGDIWFAHCLCAPHCERQLRPLQCRFYPACPHIDRRGALTLIWFPGASAGAEEVPYQCPLIEERIPLNRDFLQATYTVCRHLMRDPQIYDLFLFDSRWRREDPDFDEDDARIFP